MTHLWAGERSELAGLSPATTSADSHPPAQPAPPCHLSQGRRVRSGVSRECYLGSPRRHSPAPACCSALPVRSFSAGKPHSVTNFSCLWALQRPGRLKLVQEKVL